MMKRIGFVVTVLSLLAGGEAYAGERPLPDEGSSEPMVPRIDGEYINIYQPVGDVFPGPSVGQLVAGKHYEEWVPNDHCFVKDASRSLACFWHHASND